MNLSEKVLNSSKKFEGKILKLYVDEVELPNGHKSFREVVRHPGASAVIVLLDDGRIVLERQFRYPIREILWEIPAGKLDKDEDPFECAKRELLEETGISALKWQKLGYIYTTPGFSDEKIHLYFASGISNGNKHLDEDEFIEIKYFKVEEVEEMIMKNEITDSKTIAAFFRAKGMGLL
ncbi:MAG: ADP-ribose pyrophosphatase [Mesoaciditoga sp.]|uniref:NUDIX domain-containing protein n=1 Tax=Athalassotoga sp. TaxID=2022597 RepID=UPI000CC92AB2|nr:MAG: ADP-ribose pyrophosphatase [Mesoaciditoga sp.]PMP80666.1 MAG: ADP-ribose pyrophosphatase [Mesoaciditoga sp.]HEU24117.1 NUDIX hydrolase [Mesoaciditoga lauensis]